MTKQHHTKLIRTLFIILITGLFGWLVLRPTTYTNAAELLTTSDDLVGYWAFDEGSGTIANDSSGNSYDGTLINGPTYNVVVPSTTFTNLYALQFDGVDDYVSLPYMIDPAATEFTVSMWFNVNNLDTSRRLLAQEDGTGTGRNWLNVRSEGVLHTFLGGSGLFGTQTISTNSWHHAAVTYDGTTLTMYLDGIFDASDLRTMEASDGPMRVGLNQNDGNSFWGFIDDLRLYDRALSTPEIELLANGDNIIITDDSYTTDEDVSVTSNVLDNDDALDGTLTATIHTAPANGTVELQADGSFTYTPTANFNGSDSFIYNAGNSTSTATATVTITINPINDAPIAVDDSAVTQSNVSLLINVLDNDTDIEGDASLTAVGTPIHGTAVISGTAIWYTPPVDVANASDTFTYTLSDGSASSTASVTVETITFELASSLPTHQALNVDVSSPIILTFTGGNLDASTISQETIGIYGHMGAYDWTYTVEGNSLTINPTTRFFPGDVVQITLSDGLQNTVGMSLAATQLQLTVETPAAEPCIPTFTDIGVVLGGTNNVAWGDYDNDGDLDIFVGDHLSKIYRNDGEDTFVNTANLSGDSYDMAWGDYDNDGDLDILFVGSGPVLVYRNDGGDTFTDIGTGLLVPHSDSVAWGDYDNDGDLDILLSGGDSRVYRNEGDDTFTDISAGLTGVFESSVEWGDYDNDGDLDILLTGLDGGFISKVYRNDGLDTFTDINASLTGVFESSVGWGDYDNDGDLDILVIGQVDTTGFPIPRTSQLYRNDGSDTFTDISAGLTAVSEGSVAWGDVDSDGDLDILLVGNNGTDDISQVYRNDGADTFTNISAGISGSSHATWGDYDNDGDLDILTTGSSGSSIYRNDHGCGILVSHTPSHQALNVSPDQPITLNFSRDVDAATITAETIAIHGQMGAYAWTYAVSGSALTITPTTPFFPGDIVHVTVSNGVLDTNGYHFIPTQFQFTVETPAYEACVPTFSNITNISDNLPDISNGSVAWGDYDNDGDLDILITGSDTSQVYRNDGAETFTDIGAGLTGVSDSSVAWGDYDNDGDLDILLTGNATTTFPPMISQVYRNDGADIFTDISAGLTGVPNSSVAWGDYDNDGDLDILLTGSGTSQVYRNDGTDTFTDISAGLTGVDNSSVAWGDYDNDGDLDILLTGHIGGGDVSQVYRNDGLDIFTDIGAGLTGVTNGSVAWGDYDNDGDLDILLTGHGGAFISQVYRNDGADTFTNIGTGLPGVYLSSVAWGDVDNDGDLDIFLTGDSSSGHISTIYRNEGDGSFTDISVGLTGVSQSSVAWGDYDNDGDLDILLTGSLGGGNVSQVYRNDHGCEIIADSYSTDEDITLTTTSATGVFSNDTVGAHSATLVSDVSHGTLELQADGSFVYTPTANFYGTDNFVYQFSGRSDMMATVTILVTANADGSVVAVDDSYTVEENSQLIVVASSLLDNDTDPDPDGNSLDVSLVTAPTNGTVILDDNGTFAYIPNTDFTGIDTFTYAVYDGYNTDTATVTIMVEASLAGSALGSPTGTMALGTTGLLPILAIGYVSINRRNRFAGNLLKSSFSF